MISWRVSGWLGAVLLSAYVVPGAAATPAAVTLRAATTAEGILVLDSAAVVDQRATRVTGGGQVSGFAILSPVPGAPPLAAEVRVRGWRVGASVTTETPVRLPAGRYRVVVFADRPTRLTIPLRSGRSRTVAAHSRTTGRLILEDLTGAAPLVAPDTRSTVPYGGSFILSQTYFASRAHQVEAVSQCFAPAAAHAQTCINEQGFTGTLVTVGSVGDGYTSQLAAAYGDELPRSQPVDALLEVADVDAPSLAQRLLVTA